MGRHRKKECSLRAEARAATVLVALGLLIGTGAALGKWAASRLLNRSE
ncbi:hypothetical protein [Streptomyces iconiensis]|uniref:Uncharacterized protein n=1 Tax=Streptomyces iconiensis TaxID=1384038 RepID=A0ABT7A5Q3_9ACTN|nr:hypothetical protein [Streptomyces iconiensis]MDJ1135958.1 hypothetical protein [Streptomyces iconiensis]